MKYLLFIILVFILLPVSVMAIEPPHVSVSCTASDVVVTLSTDDSETDMYTMEVFGEVMTFPVEKPHTTVNLTENWMASHGVKEGDTANIAVSGCDSSSQQCLNPVLNNDATRPKPITDSNTDQGIERVDFKIKFDPPSKNLPLTVNLTNTSEINSDDGTDLLYQWSVLEPQKSQSSPFALIFDQSSNSYNSYTFTDPGFYTISLRVMNQELDLLALKNVTFEAKLPVPPQSEGDSDTIKPDTEPPVIVSLGVSNNLVSVADVFQLEWEAFDRSSGIDTFSVWQFGPTHTDWQELKLRSDHFVMDGSIFSTDIQLPQPGFWRFFVTGTDKTGNQTPLKQAQRMTIGVNVSEITTEPDIQSIIEQFSIDNNRGSSVSAGDAGDIILYDTASSASIGTIRWSIDSPTDITRVRIHRGNKDCIKWKTVKVEDYSHNPAGRIENIIPISRVSPGRYCYRIVAIDQFGEKTISEQIRARVIRDTATNEPPITDFQIDPVLVYDNNLDPFSFVFDASGTIDPEGGDISYKWQSRSGVAKTGQRVIYNFNTAGAYQVTLTATDDQGKSSTRTQDLIIPDDPYAFDSTKPEAELYILEAYPHVVNQVVKGGFVELGWRVSDAGIINSGLADVSIQRTLHGRILESLQILPQPHQRIESGNRLKFYSLAGGTTTFTLTASDRAGNITEKSVSVTFDSPDQGSELKKKDSPKPPKDLFSAFLLGIIERFF